MGRSKKEIKTHYPSIKEMYEQGCKVKEISAKFGLSKEAIYNAITIMGISLQSKAKEENFTYADNSVILKKIIIDGKQYTDITPIFAPR